MPTHSTPSKRTGLVQMSNGTFDILNYYNKALNEDPDVTMPIAAIESLVALIAESSSTTNTISEFIAIIERGVKVLKASVQNAISLSAGCYLFLRYIVRALEDPRDFDACKAHLLSHGRLFVERAKMARSTIAAYGAQVVRDGSVVLIHGFSRVVTALLLNAAEKNVRFQVIATETRPGSAGLTAATILREKGIPVALIHDSAVGYVMKKVDMVIVGAEGVVENGGIINIMGTYQIAVLAKSSNKPLYVCAESHKFVRLFPLDQFDLPVVQGVLNFTTESDAPPTPITDITGQPGGGKRSAPLVDYTGPEYISALISDGGVLTPRAVSEELIKIYL